MAKVSLHGWQLGLRFDPLIHGENWKYLYKELVDEVFSKIRPESVHSGSFGALRFPKAMFKKIQRLYPREKVFVELFDQENHITSYRAELQVEMIEFCKRTISRYVRSDIFFDCMSEY